MTQFKEKFKDQRRVKTTENLQNCYHIAQFYERVQQWTKSQGIVHEAEGSWELIIVVS